MPGRLISRVELARLGSRSPAAVTKACRPGGELHPATVGKRVDVDHPAAVKWLSRTDGVTPKTEAPPQYPEPAPTAPPHSELAGDQAERLAAAMADAGPVDAAELEELHAHLAPLLARFGTSTAFKDYLAALKTIVEIREKDLKNAEARGRLISRDLVAVHVFGYLEATSRRLLTESVSTIARRCFADAKAGRTVQEAERTVHDIISTQLKTQKQRVSKAFRSEQD